MITSLFRKSTLLNYSVLILATLICFFVFQYSDLSTKVEGVGFIEKAIVFCALFASLFVMNFVVKKNGLSKDSSYAALFFLLFLLFSPTIFDNLNLIVSNLFVLLAFRRLLSLQSLKSAKEKVFDASLWIFIAALFHFWSILFIILVFLSIIVHVARDFRSWILPFIALLAAVILFLLYSLAFDESRIDHLIATAQINFRIDYFTNNFQNLALALYVMIAVFFVASLVMTFSSRPLIVHSAYNKTFLMFAIGIIIFIISPAKSNDLLIFTIAPLSIMATSHIEMQQPQWQREVVLAITILISLFTFFSQL